MVSFGGAAAAGGALCCGLYGAHAVGAGAPASSAIRIGSLAAGLPGGISELTRDGITTRLTISLCARRAVSRPAQSRNAIQSRYVTNAEMPMPMIWPVNSEIKVPKALSSAPTKNAHA